MVTARTLVGIILSCWVFLLPIATSPNILSEVSASPSAQSTGANMTATQTDQNDTAAIDEILSFHRGPLFVFDKVVLQPGQNVSGVIPQTPVKAPDGHVEENKAIIVNRGNFRVTSNGSDFISDPNGQWFFLRLLQDGEVEGITAGPLSPRGFFTDVSCTKSLEGALDAGPISLSQSFICFFEVSEDEDSSVRVHWSMYHPPGGQAH